MTVKVRPNGSNPQEDVLTLADPEAEKALLGAILIGPENLHEVAAVVRDDDFSVPEHRYIWRAMRKVMEEHDSLDVVLIMEALEKMGKAKEVGGLPALIHLTTQVPSSLHAMTYAQRVAGLALRRRLITLAKEALAVASDMRMDPNEAVYRVMMKAQRLSEHAAAIASPSFTIREALERTHDYILRAAKRAQDAGTASIIRWPWPTPRKLAVVEPGDLALVIARPSVGKTTWLIHVALENAIPNWDIIRRYLQRGEEPPEPEYSEKAVVFATLEMSAEQVTQRMLALLSGVPLSSIRRGYHFQDEVSAWKVARAEEILAGAEERIIFEHRPGATPSDIQAAILRHGRKMGLSVALVDYAGLLRAPGRSAYEEASRVSVELQAVARRIGEYTGGALLVAAQMSRAVELRADKEPHLSDIRDSGRWEEVADYIIGLWLPEMPQTATEARIVRMKALKARQDAAYWQVELLFDPPRMLMLEVLTEGGAS